MRQSTVPVALAVVLAVLVAVPAAGLAGTASTQSADTAETVDRVAQNENATAPGEQLSGAVGVQGAELEGDLDQRAFGIAVAQAASQQGQADIVAAQYTNISERLAALEERKAALEAQLAAGEIREGKYRAEMAKLAAATQTARSLANQTGDVATQLPAAMLEERGVNATAIQTLQDRASNLTGPEVAEIARGIAGPNAGQTPADNRSIDVPDRPEQAEDDDRGQGDDRSGDGQGDDRSGDGQGEGDDQSSDGESGDGTPTDDDDDQRSDGEDTRSEQGNDGQRDDGSENGSQIDDERSDDAADH